MPHKVLIKGTIMIKNQFMPAWWFRSSHLQTIYPVVCRRSVNLNLERERLELPDGDFIDLDWLYKDKKAPLVLILHGLEGSIESHYAKGILLKLASRGWRGVFMHFRGCSGEPNRLPRDYHSGETTDVIYVVNKLLEREPHVQLAAIGYSLGGNVLLKWLGETNEHNPLKAAVAISVPFELHKAAKHIRQGFAKFYQWYFIKCLRQRLSQKFKAYPTFLDPDILYQVNTMIDFDNQITAPLHGFANADEYYSTASSRQYLHSICVPTLILHAKDDPFMTEDVIPDQKEISPKVQLEVTDYGGHVGFVYGYPWRPQFWLEERIPDFLQEIFK